MKIDKVIIIIAIFAAIIISGCTNQVNTGNTNGLESKTSLDYLKEQSKILKFSDETQLKTFLENNQDTTSYYYGGYATGLMRNNVDFAMESAVPTGAMAKTSEDAGSPQANAGNFDGDGVSDYSTTNVQVAGVDEADIVKTDGKYIYAVVKSTIFIIDAENLEIKSRITFKNAPSEMYINDNKIIVFGNDYDNNNIKSVYYRYTSFTYLRIFDITDKENPIEVKNYDLEGYYSNSRMIGDYVYLITDSYTDINYIAEDESVVPKLLDNGVEKSTSFPDIYYFRMPYNSYKMTTISAINVKDTAEDITREVYMLSDSQNIYVSQSNIYITYTKYISEYDLMMDVTKEIVTPKLSDKEKEKIEKIKNTDSDVLSDYEKNTKIMQIITYYTQRLSEEEQTTLEEEVTTELKNRYEDISKELQKTVIHKIAIDKNKIEYQVTGEVTGRVLNQFSMDEKDGTFRIATTKDRTWSYILNMIETDNNGETIDSNDQKSYNNIYVLDSDLKMVGKLENIATDEQIYSVRFMQDRVYMVTFRQTDPLFVIDLSDAENPTILGELKIPGYSTYLHPYDDTHIIGLGYDTKENEWGGVQNTGIKVALFDVSDVSNPTLIDDYVIGDVGTSSQALYDHKAFLFSHDKNLLVIPAEVRETSKDENQYWGKLTFSGALVFNIDEKGLDLKGKISHATENDKKAMENEYWYYNYETSVKRSLYIGDKLYTLSDKYVKENDLSDLSETNSLEFKDAEYVISGPEDNGSNEIPVPVPMPLVK